MLNVGSVMPNSVELRQSSQVFHSAVALTPASRPMISGMPMIAGRRNGSSAIR